VDGVSTDFTLMGEVWSKADVLVSRQNQEYVEASNKLENVSAMLEQVEAMVRLLFSDHCSPFNLPDNETILTDLLLLFLQPDNVKSLLISSSSIPKLQDRESLLKDVTAQVGKAKDEVDRLKPEWIEGARRAEQ